ncbi:Cellobiose dehydrogenase [Phytophthora nicotianae]|uniref:Cellobiose dehydrogenase n=1 Tax=Phytophthora nicotianae TaxID=4792 RepID=A0A0W8CNZ3_PHYNI|nr:Cellobiose dehydrogenase [Phytophthora nicotianae]
MVSNKNLSAFFYAPLCQGLFRCNICGSTRKQAGGTGYSNLIAHLDGKHAGYDAQYTAAQGDNDSPLESFGFVAEELSHLFQWIQWIIMRNMPVHEVEDAFTRAMSKLRPVTVKSVQKCMEGIAIKVGQQLEKELGELFGLMFDGWSHAGIHYVALFAVYEADAFLRVNRGMWNVSTVASVDTEQNE